MNIQTLFPQFFEKSSTKADPRWQEDFDFSTDQCVELVRLWMQEVNLLHPDYRKQNELTIAICQDLISLRAQYIGQTELLIFLQFEICTEMASVMGAKKLFTELFQWVANALSDDVSFSTSKQTEMAPLVAFTLSNNPYVKRFFNETFIKWSAMLFYQQRVKGGLKHLSKAYIDHLFAHLKFLPGPMHCGEDIVNAFSNILVWAANNKLEEIKKDCAQMLCYFYTREFVEPHVKRKIAIGFCFCGSEHTPLSQQEWCDTMLKCGLTEYEAVQVFSQKIKVSSEAILEHLETLLQCIAVYNLYIEENIENTIHKDYEISRMFSVIKDVIHTLLDAGEVSTVILIIGNFFKVPQQDLYGGAPVIIQHNVEQGVQYSTEHHVIHSGTDPLVNGPLIISKLNQFLSQSITVIDDFQYSQAEELEGEIGFPVSDHGVELEKILVEHFQLKREDIAELLHKVTGYYLYSEFQLPLQALFLKYTGAVMPLIQSFRIPYQTREIKKILIWQGDLPMAQYECDGLQQIFEQKGIQVERYNWIDHTPEEFALAYQDDSYDLVWMSCHGQFNHFRPHDSYLLLNRATDEVPEKRLQLDQLLYHREKAIGRRLLALNACDGATTTLLNSPGSVGFGASLVSCSQSLLSHQWPIDDYAGLVLGLLVGVSLAEGKTYLESFKDALLVFFKGQEAVVETLKQSIPEGELYDRIEFSAKIEYHNLYYYGSLTYLE